ncbi:MAG: esterase-like activity of phytase family protein [Betaproteobacteria bacterium]|nr:esterase-like activity of phytase family protein [Betaproteobacteria bacterium]
MTRAVSLAVASLSAFCAVAAVSVAHAQQQFPAVLEGHSMLAAATFVAPPKNAPANLSMSGRYLHADMRRRDQPGSIPGIAFLSDSKAPRPTGMDGPFKGQPIQGFSGVKWRKDGTAWVPSDNGFGTKANSPDAMLSFHHLKPDWKTGQVKIMRTVFLHDADGKVPFNIVNSASKSRYLTGADFDIESLQIIGEEFWFGDEFGPYLIRADRNGKVLGVFETMVDGQPVRSPDHFAVSAPAVPAQFNTTVRRSRGFEGMAASPDGRFLYPMLEGPLWNAEAKGWESREGKETARILEFDVRKGAYTGRSWRYQLELAGNNIGDFNMIDADTALVIERDNGEGVAELACNGPARADCFNRPAQFKRVYKIDMSNPDANGFVRKVGYIDLLNIADPQNRARIGGGGGKFAFPQWCIEGVDVVDANHIVVLNDNNLTVSQSREFGRNEPNEIILLRVTELLSAR